MATTRPAARAGDGKFVSPLEDPSILAKAAAAAATPEPDPPEISESLVDLPGGLVIKNDIIRTAEVAELNGWHEEQLARAVQTAPRKIYHFINTLLECGVTRFGGQDPEDTRKLLPRVLTGDRDALLVGIRRATYGSEVDLPGWECPNCGKTSDLSIPLSDIPVRKLEGGAEFEVTLQRQRKAKLRLANGADQLAVFEDEDLSTAERDSILLSRCLISIIDPDGSEHVTAGFARSFANGLSVRDRHTLLDELRERQPGPRFADLKIKHDACGQEVPLLIGIGDLFRDLSLL